MRVSVVRKNLKFIPDSSRVVARYFMNGESRTQKIVARIMALDENQVSISLEHTLREYFASFLETLYKHSGPD